MVCKAYVPGSTYPAVSITGKKCQLQCDYCRGYYLSGMYAATTPGELYSLARRLYAKGARGVLVSGGFTADGKLPVKAFLPAIRRIKRELGLVVSVHAGLVSPHEARDLRLSGVDVVDFELFLDPLVVRRVMHLNRSPEDFVSSLRALADEGPPFVAPHVMLGLQGIVSQYDLEALDLALDYATEVVVVLVFTPTPGTPLASRRPPPPRNIADAIRRVAGRGVEVAVGCMRPPSYKKLLDPLLVRRELVDRIAVPPLSLIREAEMPVIRACCSLPRCYEHLFADNNISPETNP